MLKFAFHPSMQLVALHTNAPLLGRALSRDEPPPEAVREAVAGDWLVSRRGLDTFYRSLDSTEARALRAARDGATFASVCEILASDLGDDAAALEAAKLLARWLADELVSALLGA